MKRYVLSAMDHGRLLSFFPGQQCYQINRGRGREEGAQSCAKAGMHKA